MSVTIAPFGAHPDGPVEQATLSSDVMEVDVLSYGAIVRDMRVMTARGWRTVTLGFETLEPYLVNPRSFGIIAGRVANRVKDAAFVLDGTRYDLEANRARHHIHGGSEGLGKLLWQVERADDGVRLRHHSPHGHMGYPGAVTFTAEIALADSQLTFRLQGQPDRPTPISLAQHSYYNLTGDETVADHQLTVAADRMTAADADNVTIGAVVPLPPDLDFRASRPVAERPLDLNFCLTGENPAAQLSGGGLVLDLKTDQPGLQVYNAFNMTDVTAPGLGGRRYGPFAGLALEAQMWPGALHNPDFPSIIATPDNPYQQTTTITVRPARTA